MEECTIQSRKADIELVIKIPEELYEDIKEHGLCGHSSDREIVSGAIAKGNPLPKGHDDLIDKSKIKTVELEDSLHFMQWKQGSEIDLWIEADTIIPADKESET